MKRRDFLQVLVSLGAAVGALAALPAPKPPESVWSQMLDDPEWEPWDPIAKYNEIARRRVLHADGVCDDVDTLERWFEGEAVLWPDGNHVGRELTGQVFMLSRPLEAKVVAPGTVFVGNLLRLSP